MTPEAILALAIAVPALTFGTLAYFVARHWSAPLLVLALAVTGFCTTGLAMGLPRPAPLAMLAMFEDVEIAAYQLDEPHAIHIWTAQRPPVNWQLPWSEETAKKLHRASQANDGEGIPMMLKRGGAPGEFEVHPKPQQPNPPKT